MAGSSEHNFQSAEIPCPECGQDIHDNLDRCLYRVTHSYNKAIQVLDYVEKQLDLVLEVELASDDRSRFKEALRTIRAFNEEGHRL